MKKAFTLIELLVVITIMSILIAAAAVNYQKTVQLSRDSKRKADIEQIRQALETYRSENNSYPNTGTNAGLTALVPDYIGAIPTDPKSGGYTYVAGAAGVVINYSLCAALENDPQTPLTNCASRTCGSVSCNYEKNNP